MKKLCKQLTSLLLAVVMLVGMLPTITLQADAVTVTASGYCGGEGDGTNLTWTLTDDGTLTISGTGAMMDYTQEYDYGASIYKSSAPWYSLRNRIEKIVINDGVTNVGIAAFTACEKAYSVKLGSDIVSINNNAFFYCSGLTSLSIPNSVTSIGKNAFSSCKNLLSVDFSDGVKTIGSRAFSSCTKLAEIIIPDSVTTVGGGAFDSCINATKLVISQSVSTIEGSTFENCKSLTSVTIPDNVTSIGTHAFAWCEGLEEITIPDSVIYIAHSAFRNCYSLHNVVLSKNLTTIESWTFGVCTNLEDIAIPKSVTKIGSHAFCSCTQLNQIVIPDSVTNIELLAFSECTSMTAAYFEGNAPAVVGASETFPSFEAAPVTLYYNPGTSGWTDSDAYDAEAGTWNGYKLAVWEELAPATTYTVTFNTNGGSAVEAQTITEGGVVTEPAAPTKDGYTFAGWYSDEALTTAYDFSTAVTDSLTLYAKWDDLPDGLLAPLPQQVIDDVKAAGLEISHIHDYDASGFASGIGDIGAFQTNVADPDSSTGKVTVISPKNSVKPWRYYQSSDTNTQSIKDLGFRVYSGGTSIGSISLATLRENEGEYHLYKFPDLVLDKGAWLGLFLGYPVQNPSLINSHKAMGLTGSAVDLYLSMKVVGDPVFDGYDTANKDTWPVYYIDRVLVVSDCDDFEVGDDYEIVTEADCENNAVVKVNCPMCGTSGVKEAEGTALGHTISAYSYNAEIGRYTATCTRSGCGEVVTLETVKGRLPVDFEAEMISKNIGFVHVALDYLAKDCTTNGGKWSNKIADADSPLGTVARVTNTGAYAITEENPMILSSNLGSIEMGRLTVDMISGVTDGKYHMYKIGDNVKIPSSNFYKFGQGGHFLALWSDLAAFAGQTKDIYVSMKIQGSYYYVDRIIFMDECSDHITDDMWVDNGQNVGIYTAECPVCHNIHTKREEDNILASGYCGGEGDGTNLTWELADDGTLIISGIGEMKNYSTDSGSRAPWYSYRSQVKSAIIGDGVTTIGDYAFAYCDSLTGVTIGDSVTAIGEWAFYWCDRLTHVTIPDSVTTIGEKVFCLCSGLTSVAIGNSVTVIGDGVFDECIALTSVTIPDGVTTIGNYAFSGCILLTSITIPNSVTTIGDYAFYNCQCLTDMTIPDSVTTIGNNAFETCRSLTSVTIGNSVTTIGDYAFVYCDSLTDVTIPDSVTTIGNNAFQYTSVEEAYFKGNAPVIGESIFYSPSTMLYYNPGTSGWTDSDAYDAEAGTWNGYKLAVWEELAPATTYTVTFNTNGGSAVEAQRITEGGVVTEPAAPTKDGYTFAGWYTDEALTTAYDFSTAVTSDMTLYAKWNDGVVRLHSATILQDLTMRVAATCTSINDLTEYGAYFLRVSKLDVENPTVADIISNADTAVMNSTNGGAYVQSGKLYANYYEEVYAAYEENDSHWIVFYGVDSAGAHYSSIVKYSLKTYLERMAQRGSDIYIVSYYANSDNLEIARQLCPKNEFAENLSLTKEGYVFAGWYSDEAFTTEYGFSTPVTGHLDLYAKWEEEQTGIARIGDIYYETLAEAVEAVAPKGNIYLLGDCDETIKISKHMVIYRNGFSAPNLTVTEDFRVDITEEKYVFRYFLPMSGTCGGEGDGSNLTWELSAANVLSITGTGAMADYEDGTAPWYAYRTYINKLVVDDEVTTIGDYAFKDSFNLSDAVLGSGIVSIGNCAFENCVKLKEVQIPDSVNVIKNNVFVGCPDIVVTPPANKEIIVDSNSLFGSENLTEISITHGVTIIGDGAFGNCANLETVVIPRTVHTIGNLAFAACGKLKGVYFLGNAPKVVPASDSNHSFNADMVTLYYIPGTSGWLSSSAYDAETGTWNGYKLAVWEEMCVARIGETFYGTLAAAVTAAKDNDTIDLLQDATTSIAVSKPLTIRRNGFTVDGLAAGGSYAMNTAEEAYTFYNLLPTGGTCGPNLTWELSADGILTISGTGAMADFDQGGAPWYELRQHIKSIVIGDQVTTIGSYAFEGCTRITAIYIPASVTIIKSHAFAGCINLENVKLNGETTVIEANAFIGCTKLVVILLPDGTTEILDKTFEDCSGLKEINIPDYVKSIGRHAFYNCDGLTEVSIPAAVETIGEGAFADCAELTGIFFFGNAPAVVPADDPEHTFDAELVTLYYIPGMTGWIDSEFYDAEAGTWNGYKLAIWEEMCVARIGDVFYGNLADAVTAVAENGTIELLRNTKEDITISKVLTINRNSRFAFNLSVGEGYVFTSNYRVYTVTAKKAFYTVSFDANNGTGTMAPVTVAGDTEYVLPECGFTAPEYLSFFEWVINGRKYKAGDIIIVDNDLVVKAAWAQNRLPDDLIDRLPAGVLEDVNNYKHFQVFPADRLLKHDGKYEDTKEWDVDSSLADKWAQVIRTSESDNPDDYVLGSNKALLIGFAGEEDDVVAGELSYVITNDNNGGGYKTYKISNVVIPDFRFEYLYILDHLVRLDDLWNVYGDKPGHTIDIIINLKLETETKNNGNGNGNGNGNNRASTYSLRSATPAAEEEVEYAVFYIDCVIIAPSCEAMGCDGSCAVYDGTGTAATIDEQSYDHLEGAVEAATANDVIELQKDIYAVIEVTKPIIIYRNGFSAENLRAGTGYALTITEDAYTVTATGPVAGDINGDGEVGVKDLTRLFQYLADWEVEVNEAVLDVNGDGSINLKDQTRLFQYLADWDVEIYPVG